MEVNFPSGFTPDIDALPSLEVSYKIRKAMVSPDSSTVFLYFTNKTVQEICPTVSAFKTHKIAKEKPIYVSFYDNFDSSKLYLH